MSVPQINFSNLFPNSIDLTQTSQTQEQIIFNTHPVMQNSEGPNVESEELNEVFGKIKSEFNLPNISDPPDLHIKYTLSNDLYLNQQSIPNLEKAPISYSIPQNRQTLEKKPDQSQLVPLDQVKSKKRKLCKANKDFENEESEGESPLTKKIKKAKPEYENIRALTDDLMTTLQNKFPSINELESSFTQLQKFSNQIKDKKEFEECINKLFNELLSQKWKEKFTSSLSLRFTSSKIENFIINFSPLLLPELKNNFLNTFRLIKPGRAKDIVISLKYLSWQKNDEEGVNKLTNLFQTIVRYNKNSVLHKPGKKSNCKKLISDLFSCLDANKIQIVKIALTKLSIEDLNLLQIFIPEIEEHVKNQLAVLANANQEQNKKYVESMEPTPFLTNTSEGMGSEIIPTLPTFDSALTFSLPFPLPPTSPPISLPEALPKQNSNDVSSISITSIKPPSLTSPFNFDENFSFEELNYIYNNIPKIKNFIKKQLEIQPVENHNQISMTENRSLSSNLISSPSSETEFFFQDPSIIDSTIEQVPPTIINPSNSGSTHFVPSSTVNNNFSANDLQKKINDATLKIISQETMEYLRIFLNEQAEKSSIPEIRKLAKFINEYPNFLSNKNHFKTFMSDLNCLNVPVLFLSKQKEKDYSDFLNEVFKYLLSANHKERFKSLLSLNFFKGTFDFLEKQILILLKPELQLTLKEVIKNCQPIGVRAIQKIIKEFEWNDNSLDESVSKLTILFETLVGYRKNLSKARKGPPAKSIANISFLFENMNERRTQAVVQTIMKFSEQDLTLISKHIPLVKAYLTSIKSNNLT